MTKYLYGASVQGIQEFIFQTGKLKEIVGASEIVEKICTSLFKNECANFNNVNLIIGAAGNIKYVFDNKADCERMFLTFPKTVMESAPGITISQAVIPLNGDNNLVDAIGDLEEKLKAQRNIPATPFETGYAVLERARRTGGVAFNSEKGEFIDEATRKKIDEKSLNLYNKFTGLSETRREVVTYDFNQISKGGKDQWIAVIHADGNGVGKIVQTFGEKFRGRSLNDQIKAYRDFSKTLEECTKIASKQAFETVVQCHEFIEDKVEKFPIRPIILGGDDITLVIRADLALDFTNEYLKEFEIQCAKNHETLHGTITACAGIAYIKDSYPFHYGVALADNLCKEAKGFSKANFGNEIPSSLSFFKVHDSFIEKDMETIRKRTQKPEPTSIDYHYGPYLIEDQNGQPNVGDLTCFIEKIKTEAKKNNKDKAVSKLRQIVSESFKNNETAAFMRDRMKEINNDFYNDLELDKHFAFSGDKSIVYDAIQIYSLLPITNHQKQKISNHE